MDISKQLFCNQIPIPCKVGDAHRMFLFLFSRDSDGQMPLAQLKSPFSTAICALESSEIDLSSLSGGAFVYLRNKEQFRERG